MARVPLGGHPPPGGSLCSRPSPRASGSPRSAGCPCAGAALRVSLRGCPRPSPSVPVGPCVPAVPPEGSLGVPAWSSWLSLGCPCSGGPEEPLCGPCLTRAGCPRAGVPVPLRLLQGCVPAWGLPWLPPPPGVPRPRADREWQSPVPTPPRITRGSARLCLIPRITGAGPGQETGGGHPVMPPSKTWHVAAGDSKEGDSQQPPPASRRHRGVDLGGEGSKRAGPQRRVYWGDGERGLRRCRRPAARA